MTMKQKGGGTSVCILQWNFLWTLFFALFQIAYLSFSRGITHFLSPILNIIALNSEQTRTRRSIQRNKYTDYDCLLQRYTKTIYADTRSESTCG